MLGRRRRWSGRRRRAHGVGALLVLAAAGDRHRAPRRPGRRRPGGRARRRAGGRQGRRHRAGPTRAQVAGRYGDLVVRPARACARSPGAGSSYATGGAGAGDRRRRLARRAAGRTVRASGRLGPADDDDLAGGALARAARPRWSAAPDVWWRGAAAVRASIRDAVAHRPADQRALVPALVDGDDAGPGRGARRRLPDHRADPPARGVGHQPDAGGRVPAGAGPVVPGARPLAAGRRRAGDRRVRAAGPHRAERAPGRGDGHGRAVRRWAPTGGGAAPRALGVAVLVLLLVQPGLAVQPGSRCRCWRPPGSCCWRPGWRDALARWLPRWVAEAIAVPSAAQLACTPVVAAISGQVSLVAVAANLVVGAGRRAGHRARARRRAGRAGAGRPRAGCSAPSPAGAWPGSSRSRPGAPSCRRRRSAGGPARWRSACSAVLVVAIALAGPLLLRRPVTGRRLLPAARRSWWWSGRRPRAGRPGWVLVACDVGQGDALVLRRPGLGGRGRRRARPGRGRPLPRPARRRRGAAGGADPLPRRPRRRAVRRARGRDGRCGRDDPLLDPPDGVARSTGGGLGGPDADAGAVRRDAAGRRRSRSRRCGRRRTRRRPDPATAARPTTRAWCCWSRCAASGSC